MGIEAPELDDRRFDDLLAEARALIPRYAPEWTDHNESDPGIALVQLQAWFTDLVIYRLNQVPERNYIKFLQLLGIQVKPASPARVDVTFVTSKPDADAIVPAGTQIATAGAGSDPPVVFELATAFPVIGPHLAAVQVYDGFAFRDVTTANASAGQGIDPFGPRAHLNSALLVGFRSPGPFTSSSICLMLYAEQPRTSPIVEVDLEALPVPPPASLAYEYWDGASWTALVRDVDETFGLLRTGRIVVAGPGARAVKAAIGQTTEKLYWIRVRLIEQGYDRVPRLSQVAVNTATAIAAVTIRDEVLGGSDGMPDQGPFQVASLPVVPLDRSTTLRRSDGRDVLLRSLHLEIDEGSGFEPWIEVDDFLASTAKDPHFVLDRTTGRITFGDGRFGAIPLANAANPTANIVARRYLAGGGARTNVGAGMVTVLQTAAPGITSATNERPASGGADEERVEDAKRRAPSALQARGRAVTAGDFELLTLEARAPVRRAKALALNHPGFPGIPVPGAVTVIVVPDVPGSAPRPSETTLRIVCEHLNRHRLITTEVFAVGPAYRRVCVVGDIVARGDADLAEVSRAVATRLKEWLHALTGGDDGDGWPFGGTIFASSLYRVALLVKGVDRIKDNQLLVEVDGDRQAFCRDVPIGPGELIEPLEPQLTVTYQ